MGGGGVCDDDDDAAQMLKRWPPLDCGLHKIQSCFAAIIHWTGLVPLDSGLLYSKLKSPPPRIPESNKLTIAIIFNARICTNVFSSSTSATATGLFTKTIFLLKTEHLFTARALTFCNTDLENQGMSFNFSMKILLNTCAHTSPNLSSAAQQAIC